MKTTDTCPKCGAKIVREINDEELARAVFPTIKELLKTPKAYKKEMME